jgi:hypothetical protein
MRALLVTITITFTFAFVTACGSKGTSPAGPVGKPVDFRSKLKPEVAQRAPGDEKATRHELPTDLHGVDAKLVWRTFEDGPNKYVLSAQWEVIKPKTSITLEPIDTAGMTPTNAGTPEAVNEKVIVRVRWRENGSASTSFGESSFQVAGDGHSEQL